LHCDVSQADKTKNAEMIDYRYLQEDKSMILSTLLLAISSYILIHLYNKPQEPKRIPIKVRSDKINR